MNLADLYLTIKVRRDAVAQEMKGVGDAVRAAAASINKDAAIKVAVTADTSKLKTQVVQAVAQAHQAVAVAMDSGPYAVKGVAAPAGGRTFGGGPAGSQVAPYQLVGAGDTARQQHFKTLLDEALADAEEKYEEAAKEALSSPARSANGGTGSGGRSGMSRFRNPLSAMGLSRLLGGGLYAFGALEALHAGTQFANAADTEAHPERVLNAWANLGDRHDAYSDPLMRGQAGVIASADASHERLGAVESVPVLGSLVKFGDALVGASRSLEDLKKNISDVVAVHQYAQKSQDETEVRNAELTHDPIAVLEAKQKAEAQTDDAALAKAKQVHSEAMARIKDKYLGQYDPNYVAAEKAHYELKHANEDKAELRKKEMEQAKADVASKSALSAVTTARSYANATAINAEAAGDPVQAMQLRHTAEQRELSGTYNAKRSAGNLSDQQRRDLVNEEAGKTAEMAARQTQEEDELRRHRERAEGDSAARVQDIIETSQEKFLRARGQAYNADVAAAKRATDAKVEDLQRQEKAETDQAKKKQLRDQIAAERQAGNNDLLAMRLEHAERTRRETEQSKDNAGADELEARGETTAARNKRLQDEHDRRVADIRKANDPDADEQVANADRDFEAKKKLNAHADEKAARRLKLESLDANADAAGDPTTGRIEELREKLRDMQKDAGGDRQKQIEIKNYGLAKLRQLRQSMNPNVTYGDAESFSSNLGNAIGNSAMTNDSQRLLDKTSRELTSGPNGITDDLDQTGAKMGEAAKKFDEAVDKLTAKPLVVVG